MTEQAPENFQKFGARIPADVYIALKEKAEEQKDSVNALLVRACREFLKPTPLEASKAQESESKPPQRRLTAAELAIKFGLKTGGTIEEVEPRMDRDSGFIATPLTAEPEELSEDERFRREYIGEFGANAYKVMCSDKAMMRLTWPKRIEATRERRERELGS